MAWILVAVLLAAGLGFGRADKAASISDCSLQRDAEAFGTGLRQHMELLSRRTDSVTQQLSFPAAPKASIQAQAVFLSHVPFRNYIDEFIFGKMQEDGIPHAPLASDAEFLRRTHLDLTGRIPTADDVRAFLNSSSPLKRSEVIQQLLASDAFVDKWTMYYGDLLKNTSRDLNVIRFAEGRDAFYDVIRDAVQSAMPYDVFVRKLITGAGSNSYVSGEANWAIGGLTPMGPIQDTMDTLAVRSATQFLGMSQFDCLLCHDGAGHLESLSLWGSKAQRREAWEMAAFFSRLRVRRVNLDESGNQYYWSVTDDSRGEYQLNTTAGNRTPRQPIGNLAQITPRYIFAGTQVPGATYRDSFANNLVLDRQFARAAVNYLWKEMMGMGIVEPADQFDPARLDPANPPPSPWTLQPTHPELLEALADDFIASGFNIRAILGRIADSSAYQLSAHYSGEWRVEFSAYFARKNVRRLWAEEIHDAIFTATGVGGSYVMRESDRRVEWAMQLPEPVEPRSNRTVSSFLDVFLRGDRDQQVRSGDATIQQALNMMNNIFVTSRIRATTPGSKVGGLLANTGLTNDQLIEELFLATLSRYPTPQEAASARAAMSPNRTAGAENLQWVLLNKIDFLYNY